MRIKTGLKCSSKTGIPFILTGVSVYGVRLDYVVEGKAKSSRIGYGAFNVIFPHLQGLPVVIDEDWVNLQEFKTGVSK